MHRLKTLQIALIFGLGFVLELSTFAGPIGGACESVFPPCNDKPDTNPNNKEFREKKY